VSAIAAGRGTKSEFSDIRYARQRDRAFEMIENRNVRCLAEVQANIFCRRVAPVPYGTHTVFIREAKL
jgi:hypothetical protein